ncbi:MAG TPA: hypothetical protein VKB89_16165 [Xanthobacteraceae bacterium]|nr:hypothetical protein [Xanthobacteraceae bacterium]
MAFDNCTELERWQELTDFAAELNKDGERIHFTLFVSASNFIADTSRNIYEVHTSGVAIPASTSAARPSRFANASIEVTDGMRGNFVSATVKGVLSWSASDWDKEFRAFGQILKNVGPNNGLPGAKFAFPITDVIGFRAPYLAKDTALYSTLKAHGFRYDTSGVGQADAWPEKIDGLWRFNLAMLRIQGSGRGTLSMDYNFFVAQSRATYDPRRYDMTREQTLQTYLRYFKRNYAGNRAPLHIGHHFMNYGGGAYNEALKSFARAVCGLPELQCVTYAKLADFMDRQNAATLAAYHRGDFAHVATPKVNVAQVLR